MSLDEKTLTTRKPLWIALSDLFMDTELQKYNFRYIAKSMRESGYSLDEIEDILMSEVLPVCIGNLHSVAGEWAGFDEYWICNKITKAKRPNRFRCWMNKRNFWMIENDWAKVIEVYKQL